MYEKAAPDNPDWPQRFSEIREAGYDYMELSIDESDTRLARLEWTDRQIISFSQLARDGGISLGSICLSGQRRFPFGLEGEKPLELIAKAIRFASLAGIPIIQMAGYDVYYQESTPETIQRFADKLHKAALLAARAGVIIAFETMETPFMDTVGKAMKYVKMVNSPYLQVYPDLGNLNNAALLYHHSVPDDLETGRGHIVATHIKETVPGTYRNMFFGKGQVDFSTLLKKTYELGVRRYVTELWYLGSPSWKTDLENATIFVKTILDHIQPAN